MKLSDKEKKVVVAMIQNLLDDEEGVNEQAYNKIIDFADLSAIPALDEMLKHTDATDGRFYLPEGYVRSW